MAFFWYQKLFQNLALLSTFIYNTNKTLSQISFYIYLISAYLNPFLISHHLQLTWTFCSFAILGIIHSKNFNSKFIVYLFAQTTPIHPFCSLLLLCWKINEPLFMVKSVSLPFPTFFYIPFVVLYFNRWHFVRREESESEIE